MDFQDVANWQNNKLDRKDSSRMGWSDLSICLKGPVVEDLMAHFTQRWNFIYKEKYDVRKDSRYHLLDYRPTRRGVIGHPFQAAQGEPAAEVPGDEEPQRFRDRMRERVEEGRERLEEGRDRFEQHLHHEDQDRSGPLGGIPCQIMRSCCKWSHGVSLEHSICNAYIDVIKNSQHFVYIENQFFITATDEKQKPIKNRIGAAIAERIIRAARNDEKYQVIVCMPAIPAFAGDLRSDDALATRAIMEFQYVCPCKVPQFSSLSCKSNY